jgi:hypothetical protein
MIVLPLTQRSKSIFILAAFIFLDQIWKNSAPKISTEIYHVQMSFVKIGTVEDTLLNGVIYFLQLWSKLGGIQYMTLYRSLICTTDIHPLLLISLRDAAIRLQRLPWLSCPLPPPLPRTAEARSCVHVNNSWRTRAAAMTQLWPLTQQAAKSVAAVFTYDPRQVPSSTNQHKNIS